MDRIFIEKATKTPKILCDPENGYMLLEGRSVPENSTEFYHHILTWMEEYFNDPKETSVVEIRLEYFNTSSANIILKILRILDDNSAQGKDIVVKWCYEEDDEEYLEEIMSYKKIMKNLAIEAIEIEEF